MADYGTLACVDSNLSPNDGCNGICQVEKGWECTAGDPHGIDKCFEICGDGYNMNQYACDDGNVDYPLSIFRNNPDG